MATANQLLISYHRPHHAVKSCSIADGSRLFLLVPELTLVFLKAILRELRQLLKQGKAGHLVLSVFIIALVSPILMLERCLRVLRISNVGNLVLLALNKHCYMELLFRNII